MARNKKARMLEVINNAPFKEGVKIELDNLDKAELIKGKEGLEMENEHGTKFPLEDLSTSEVEVLLFVLSDA